MGSKVVIISLYSEHLKMFFIILSYWRKYFYPVLSYVRAKAEQEKMKLLLKIG